MKTAFSVEDIRKDFPNLNVRVKGRPLVYFDNAASTLKLQTVIDAVTTHYTEYTSNIHRGVHSLSERATSTYEAVRGKIREFINAADESEIILTSGTTDAINLVCHSFGKEFVHKGDEILITEMEHHSNIVPWQILCEEKECTLKVLPITDKGELQLDELDSYLTEKTKLVSLVYVSNSLGTVNPVKRIIDAAHAKGIPVLLDAAQAVSHTRIDVQELDCDFLAFSGHKLYGPTGTGVLYGKSQWLDKMPPYRGGGDMIKTVTFEKTTYADLPSKFEAGTPNIAGVIGLGAAVDYVSGLEYGEMALHKNAILEKATEGLKNIDGVMIIGEAENKSPVISFVIDDVHAHDLGTLIDEEGVAIRTGHHCTMPVMQHFNVIATSRASFTMYNTLDEVETFIDAVNKAVAIFRG